jgi:Uma2 family endonuclease
MATSTRAESIPVLVDGDHLDAAEFERRYRASPQIRKAELIEGVVYVASPVSETHGSPHAALTQWVGFSQVGTPYLVCSVEGTVRLDDRNQPQPDVHLRIASGLGGQSTRSADHYVEGAPELVAEISVSSKGVDLNERLEAYRRNGVREYIVWRVLDRAIDWFILRDGRFDRLALDEQGVYQSEVFPGLWLDPEALIRGDLAAVFQAVQRGLATPEHAAFVERLRQAATP